MPTTTGRGAYFGLLLVLCIALLASACMWGVVRDAETGAGIEGATITYTDSQDNTESTTSGAGGLYAFDSATGPVPAAGSVDIEVSASGYATLSTNRTISYGDNPNATFADLSSFWEVQSFELTPEDNGGLIDTLESGLDFPIGAVYDEDGDLYVSERDGCRVIKIDGDDGSTTTVAGNGTCGYSGDGGNATDAQLSSVSGLALDADGHLAIVDNGNCRVRQVDLDTDVITTVAGSGSCGFTGDGGPAASAQLGLADAMVPTMFVWSDVAFDSDGDLFIADIFNCRIRKVSGGTITTVAGSGTTGFMCGAFSGDGGAATSARLNQPSSVAVDDHDDVFIGELAGCRVRKVHNGTISTIAGTGVCTPSGNGGNAISAGLGNVRGLAVDAEGDVYISQFGFNVAADPVELRYCQVRRIDAGDDKIYALAGDGTCGDSGDGDPATSAQISTPGDIALACNGDLAFGDAWNDNVRVVLGVNNGGPAPGDICD